MEDARSIDLLINTFLVSPSSVSFSQRIAQNGNVLGRRLFEVANVLSYWVHGKVAVDALVASLLHLQGAK